MSKSKTKRLLPLVLVLGAGLACVSVTSLVRTLNVDHSRFPDHSRLAIDRSGARLLVETRSDSGVFDGLNWLSVYETSGSQNALTTKQLPEQGVLGIAPDPVADDAWYVLMADGAAGETRVERWIWRSSIWNPLLRTSDQVFSKWFSYGGELLKVSSVCDFVGDEDGRLFVAFRASSKYWVAELNEWTTFWAIDSASVSEIRATRDGTSWDPAGCPRMHHDVVSKDLYVGWMAVNAGDTHRRAVQRIDADSLAGASWVMELWLRESDDDPEDSFDVAAHQGVVALGWESNTHIYDTNVASLEPSFVDRIAYRSPSDMAIQPHTANYGWIWILDGVNKSQGASPPGHLQAYGIIKD